MAIEVNWNKETYKEYKQQDNNRIDKPLDNYHVGLFCTNFVRTNEGLELPWQGWGSALGAVAPVREETQRS